jgi:hypothetical protein
VGSLNERLERLERDEGKLRGTTWELVPPARVFALDTIAYLKREGLTDDSTPTLELEQLMIARGVKAPVAREFGEMCQELREERIARWD